MKNWFPTNRNSQLGKSHFQTRSVRHLTFIFGRGFFYANDLKQLLFSINHKSYPPPNKSTSSAYQFPRYTLSIDHVQGDPFFGRSMAHHSAAFPAFLDTYEKRVTSRLLAAPVCAHYRTVFLPHEGFRQKWSAGDKPLRAGRLLEHLPALRNSQ